MSKRAAICIGINKAGNLHPLQAAIKGAKDFEGWAASQGYDTKLFVDNVHKVSVNDIFKAIDKFVSDSVYEQIIIYFSGHGVLSGPGTEYWLLSEAPQNANEAVNLFRSVEDARNSGIPHVLFISDACRTPVNGLPLSGIIGSTIFPNNSIGPQRSEIDVFYATRPGYMAWEVFAGASPAQYKGIFTESLLSVLRGYKSDMYDVLNPGPPKVSVITSRRLKTYLEEHVPKHAWEFQAGLIQHPEIRVESALPKFFTVAPATSDDSPDSVFHSSFEFENADKFIDFQMEESLDGCGGSSGGYGGSIGSFNPKFINIDRTKIFDAGFLLNLQNRHQIEAGTGFLLLSTEIEKAFAKGWNIEQVTYNGEQSDDHYLRLTATGGSVDKYSPLLVQFSNGDGILLPILPGFTGTVIVKNNRVLNVDYIHSPNNNNYDINKNQTQTLELMKLTTAANLLNGEFVALEKDANEIIRNICHGENIDFTMAIYAAYNYAQAGKYKDVLSLFSFMNKDQLDIPMPFDIATLAANYKSDISWSTIKNYVAPTIPLLSQGWAILMPSHPLYLPIHDSLRPYLLPSLWSTYSEAGVNMMHESIIEGK